MNRHFVYSAMTERINSEGMPEVSHVDNLPKPEPTGAAALVEMWAKPAVESSVTPVAAQPVAPAGATHRGTNNADWFYRIVDGRIEGYDISRPWLSWHFVADGSAERLEAGWTVRRLEAL